MGDQVLGNHAEVLAVNNTGFAIVGSQSVQEAHDMAVIAHVAAVRAQTPFLHFFDGNVQDGVADVRLLSRETLSKFAMQLPAPQAKPAEVSQAGEEEAVDDEPALPVDVSQVLCVLDARRGWACIASESPACFCISTRILVVSTI